ncbi:MAG: tRNA (N(6)-L-threonylcarbamoyladenosine(37)-C(2))-methylthiotransferase MtaB [Bacilli bacterium]|nr:tRNA (N(6)-L-threonylcarbamoyladenosine(37)-C(2))-methylthiotransferase MtaB [Bacilli bacterium]MBR3049508.1 tRNA (N(6)-L-threonylcarbamoyladenosine(37)-C(2))-methylthiotransferase MtaB [Bacilli bacterium]
MKVGILSLGCKVNMYESEFVTNLLSKAGYEISSFNDVCDIYIINTCTVTNTSDIKSRKMIRKAIKKNPDAIVIAMGCFIEANKDVDIPGLDIIIGNKDKSKIVEIIEEYIANKNTIKRLYNDKKYLFEDMYIDNFPGRTRAFVKIQDGCENFCTYCIIPFVRGKCRSKEESNVIEEVKALVNNGYKEVVLTGIHTGSYGVDLDTSFADLLEKLVKIKGLERLRISSIETTELNEDVLKILRNSSVIVDHLHIPIQSGSNEILKLMNRKYDLDFFKDKINEIRSIRPNISITTDIIVGFPSETDELFEESIKTVKEINFSKLHVFPYSEREGTKSMDIPNHIRGDIKKSRARKMLEVSKELEINYMNKYLNKEVEILVEEYKDGYSFGHTGNYLYVKVNKKLKHNDLVKVKITSIDYPYCIGE